MKSIKENKKLITLSKEELNLLKGGQKNYNNVPKKGDWDQTALAIIPPHD